MEAERRKRKKKAFPEGFKAERWGKVWSIVAYQMVLQPPPLLEPCHYTERHPPDLMDKELRC